MGSLIWAVFVCSCATPTGSKMNKFLIVALLGTSNVYGTRQLRSNDVERDGKSLVNTFPFNAGGAEDHHHGHGDHQGDNRVSQPLEMDHQASEMWPGPGPAMMARDVLTRSRWSPRLSTTMLSSVTTATTRDVTPPMSPTTSLSRRKSVRRISEKLASLSTKRLPSTRLSIFAELLL